MTDASYWNGTGELLPQSGRSTESTTSGFFASNPMWMKGTKLLKRNSDRRLRFFMIVATTLIIVCGISGWVGWATTSIRPVDRTDLCLVTTDYHDNLLVPPGLYADRSVGRLAELFTSDSSFEKASQASRTLLRLAQSPAEFIGLESIESVLPQSKSQAFVLYIAAHGLSSSSGPILLPRNSTSRQDGVPLTKILELFKNYADDAPKALILDTGAMAADHRWGVLQNDFSFQVQSLNEQIKRIPNLTVIIDCDVDQRAWTNPISCSTVFGEAIMGGLRQSTVDNDQDGWLDMWDLYTACSKQVNQWVSTHTRFVQTPVLLPLGEDGKQRAARNVIRPTSQDPLPEPSALISMSRPEKVDQWWQAFENYNARMPHPTLITPLLWDRFVATVLRYEQFEMNGSRAAADWLDGQLRKMQMELDNGRPVESTGARAGLISPLAVGMVSPSTSLIDPITVAEHLMTTAPQSRIAAWQGSIATLSDAYEVALLRREVTGLMVTRLADSINKNETVNRNALADVAAAIQAIQDPLQPTSTLSTLVQLISRDLPPGYNSAQDAGRLARLLDLWSRCDRVTTPRTNAQLPLEPCVLPWVRDLLQQGDTSRRLAYDLLMGDEESRNRADSYLTQAEQAYQQVDDLAKVVAAAQTNLRMGWSQLSMFAAAIEIRAELAGELRATDESIAALEKAYDAAESLSDRLARPVNVDATTKESTCSQIVALDAQFKHAQKSLADVVAQWQTADLVSNDVGELVSALSSLGGTGEQRRAGWERLRLVSAQASMNDASKPSSKNAKALSRSLGRLALATWAERDFDRLSTSNSATYAQVKHQLDIFAVDSEWRDTLASIGDQIGSRYLLARQSLETVPKSTAEIEQNAMLARRFDSLLPEDGSLSIARHRNQTIIDYLITNTRRGIADCLASTDQQSMPQFARLTALMIDDVSRYAVSDQVKELHEMVLAANSLKLQAPTKVDWTTEQTKAIQVDLARQDDPNPGFVTITATTEEPLLLVYPSKDKRVSRPIQTARRVPNPELPAVLDSTLLQVSVDREKLESLTLQTSEIHVRGYFRGRILDANINIQFHAIPSQHFIAMPTTAGPRVAVRSPEGAQPVGYEGAVTVLLDCSGSMGAAQGQAYDSTTKHAQAVAAVEKLVRELPVGIRLSVWAFGQAGSPEKTVKPAEQTIRQILAPTIWNPRSSENVEQLISKLSYPASEPWNESPLIASMLAASRDLIDQQSSFRTLVVITDGFDNRIETDSANNPQRESAENVIRRMFANTGIAVNVIGFRVEQHEVQKTSDSLSVVQELIPPGSYVQVQNAEELITALRGCFARDIRYELRRLGEPQPTSQSIVIAESPSRGAIRWSNRDLQPGSYEIRCISNSKNLSTISATIEVRAGDNLVLQRTENQDLVVHSETHANSGLNQRRTISPFDVELRSEVSKRFDASSHSLSIQRSDTRPLAIQPPGDAWIFVDGQSSPIPTRWYRDAQAAGFQLRLDTFRPQSLPTRQSLQVCISPSTPVAVGRLLRNRDFKNFADLAPAAWQDSAGTVKLLDAKIETWNVPDPSGQVSAQSCLVLRISNPSGTLFRLRPLGIQFAGYDEQYFANANAYTFRAWPLAEADVQHGLQMLELISMNQVLEAAKQAGMLLDFKIETSQPEHPGTVSDTPSFPQI